MYSVNFKNSGITLMEILVSITIITILAVLGWSYMSKSWYSHALSKDQVGLISFLEEARSAAVSSKNNSKWSVLIEESKATMFSGETYIENNSANKVFLLNQSVFVSNINLSGGGNQITFSRLYGETSQSGTIILSSRNDENASTSISVLPSGVIQ